MVFRVADAGVDPWHPSGWDCAGAAGGVFFRSVLAVLATFKPCGMMILMGFFFFGRWIFRRGVAWG